jgi:hypothetical protein
MSREEFCQFLLESLGGIELITRPDCRPSGSVSRRRPRTGPPLIVTSVRDGKTCCFDASLVIRTMGFGNRLDRVPRAKKVKRTQDGAPSIVTTIRDGSIRGFGARLTLRGREAADRPGMMRSTSSPAPGRLASRIVPAPGTEHTPTRSHRGVSATVLARQNGSVGLPGAQQVRRWEEACGAGVQALKRGQSGSRARMLGQYTHFRRPLSLG